MPIVTPTPIPTPVPIVTPTPIPTPEPIVTPTPEPADPKPITESEQTTCTTETSTQSELKPIPSRQVETGLSVSTEVSQTPQVVEKTTTTETTTTGPIISETTESNQTTHVTTTEGPAAEQTVTKVIEEVSECDKPSRRPMKKLRDSADANGEVAKSSSEESCS